MGNVPEMSRKSISTASRTQAGGNRPTGAFRRRGTVMIFVLGVLTLLAIVGVVLIASTRAEQKRFANDAKGTTSTDTIESVVRVIQQFLRRDIWGEFPGPSLDPSQLIDRPLANDANKVFSEFSGNIPPYIDIQENNEPFDAPGEADRWLASTTPYLMVDPNSLPIPYAPSLVPTEFSGNDKEAMVLVWPSVSYLGTDIRQGGTQVPNTFAWHVNSRTMPQGFLGTVTYTEDVLDNVPILQTPPPVPYSTPPNYFNGPMVTGSTTNVTIARAREFWNSIQWGGATGVVQQWLALGLSPQFPYFDTNMDGVPDLYDADGDGIPDSPISFRIPAASPDSNDAENLYAVVRIVDHASMLNANVASSWIKKEPLFFSLRFDDTAPDLQRRGRRVTELLFDPLLHPGDLNGARAPGLVDSRTVAAPSNDSYLFDLNVVRRDLVGGRSGDFGYFLYGNSDEASLRHRGTLAPYARRDYDKTSSDPNAYSRIDGALPWTLLPTRQIFGGAYLSNASRWYRYNSDYIQFLINGINSVYEGFDQQNPFRLGWRTLLVENAPNALRRHMFTTISHEVQPPPDTSNFSTAVLPVEWIDLAGLSSPLSMRWPGDGTYWGTRPVDLNMTTSFPAAVDGMKRNFVSQVAAAMYTALKEPGLTKYSAYTGLTPVLDEGLKQRMAWQFAINLADYRDNDGVPTQILFTDPNTLQSNYMFGLEKQPFFTEAYVRFDAKSETSALPPDGDDTYFEAVELFLPSSWTVDVSKLYFRNSASGGHVALSSFLRNGLPLTEMDGGALSLPNPTVTGGKFFVFCNDEVPPTGMDTSTFYKSAAFDILNDGHGVVELVYSDSPLIGSVAEHVLDVIGPGNTGTLVPGDDLISGDDRWAKRPDDPGGLQDGEKWDFSLVRSTSGWRFTTAWQYYGEGKVSSVPGIQPQATAEPKVSLGLPEFSLSQLNSIPESVWPARSCFDEVAMKSYEVPDGFLRDPAGSPRFFEAFDSVGELSRMLLVGPTRTGVPLAPNPFPNIPNLALARSATEHLAALLKEGIDLPTAGRIDFRTDWTRQLFSFFTVQDFDTDGIDNDGDGFTDENYESRDVLFRQAGRLNINTAPLSVLRTVPFMNLRPDSPEYRQYAIAWGLPLTANDPAADFAANPNLFWDMAAAIVARRENRPDPSGSSVGVPVRMTDAFGVSRAVAVAKSSKHLPFQSVADLVELNESNMTDALTTGGHPSMFRIDRYESDGTIPLDHHRSNTSPTSPWPTVGVDNVFSPDFRVRGNRRTQAGLQPLIEYVPMEFSALPDFGAGGVRGRDILLSRWTNLLTTRSDVFTAYIALIDENGGYVQRSEVTFDRSGCFREYRAVGEPNHPIMPDVVLRSDSSYYDDTQ